MLRGFHRGGGGVIRQLSGATQPLRRAGVLVEMRAQQNAPHEAVVGIGLNVNQCGDDFSVELQERAISLAMALGRQVDRQKFAGALLRNLDLTYREKFSKAVVAFKSSRVPATTPDKRVAKFRTA